MTADAFLVKEIMDLFVPLPAFGGPNGATDQRSTFSRCLAALCVARRRPGPIARAPTLYGAAIPRRRPRILIAIDWGAVWLIREGGRGEKEKGEEKAHEKNDVRLTDQCHCQRQ